ncbi:unnamed protein product [Lupinus luteus]|uniref:Uncharacterized protein n=1 Tax=Lupinus luteus TaxID=3873 RepID=A0AAV1XZN2_LUPLU
MDAQKEKVVQSFIGFGVRRRKRKETLLRRTRVYYKKHDNMIIKYIETIYHIS